MLFNSYIFIFVFLPLVLLGWHGLNHFKKFKLAQCVVIAMSLWFYGYFNYSYIAMILCSILGNWLVSKGIWKFAEQSQNTTGIRTLFGVLGIAFDLGLLFYFKYYDFFIENLNSLFSRNWELKNIVLPLGISFFTFQQISFITDRMWGNAKHYDLIDYMTYVVYFPQLVAGPIVSHDDLIPQFWEEERRHFYWSHMLFGIRLFVIGLAKKVLLADELGKIVDHGFLDVTAMDSPAAFVVMLSYTFQIFFDFSGYCDMAMGLGAMMNLELPLNFNSPYKSCSVKEFWNRWHMTLNVFFTKYVYIPLGGNRCGTVKRVRNTLIVFLLSGIWHGANWTFFLWGIAHGILVSLESLKKTGHFKQESAASDRPFRFRKIIQWAYTFAFVNLAWVLFRSDSITMAWNFYKRLFSFRNTGYIWNLAGSISSYKNYAISMVLEHLGGYTMASWFYLFWMLVLLLLAVYLCTRPNAFVWVTNKEAGKIEMWGMALLFGLGVLSFSGITTFLYFNF